jgi:oxepin-CoA hydrolase / 3-oxo-5,6-dehydrosuberyl-CoA semialdehyde dehydrogenase
VTVLRSYVSGAWTEPTDEGRPVLDAVTGEQVTRVSSAGIDVAAALDYGRATGGPALRELTFHQRAGLLKSLGQMLREHRPELYALSARTGATLGDAKFDVDGGIGVLLSYASRAKRELPNDVVLAEGAVEPLGRGGAFVGQHILTSLRGVAVQINAFNFPVWGPLEKFAPAFIAGVPTLVKPATQTAYLTARLVELMLETGLLPPGSLQLVCGSASGLLDHVGEQDLVSFTGSAATAHQLRAHPAVVSRSVRFNAEADSLNCSILGPDAHAGTPEFDLYVRQLVTEMTVKAGQKCTAIRRAFVPAALAGQVAEAVRDRLAAVVVGNPAEDDVRMGALASLEQREEVRRSVKALLTAGHLIFGDPDRVEVVGASAERGAFIAPLLLHSDDPGRPEPHQVEAFGPVSTIIGYDGAAEVIELAARGRGSLAGSVVTADAKFARDVVLGLAPWHGRLLVLDRDDAPESTGHGSPLPMLVHGGPGRAGGGEEMGGMRGVLHHMQRTAVQASPRVLSAITGRWMPGTERNTAGGHPFRKSLADLRVGDSVVAGPRRVTLADIEHFAEFTGDTFYAHMDEEAARANPFFDGRVAHGYLIVSFAAGLFVQPDPGPVLANYGLENLRFLTPVYPGDELTVTLTCKQITPREDAEHGEVRWDADVTNQDGKSVATYDVLTLVAKQWPRADPRLSARLGHRDGFGHLGKHLTAVDHDRLPGDVTCLLGGQEQRGVADVVDAAQTAQRYRRRHLGRVVLAEFSQAFGDDVPRQHRVDRDAAGSQLDRGGPHEAQLPGLARSVVRPARKAGDRAGDGRDEDDPAPARAGQGGQAGLDREDGALQVDAEHLVEHLLGHVRQPAVREDPRVGAQNVDAAQPLLGDGRHPPAVLPAGHVGLDERDLAGRLGRGVELPGGGPGDVRITAGDEDARAAAGEHAGNPLADAAAAAGYHHGAAGDRCEHDSPLLSVRAEV